MVSDEMMKKLTDGMKRLTNLKTINFVVELEDRKIYLLLIFFVVFEEKN